MTETTGRGGHPRFYAILEEQADLHSRKNHDYAAGGAQGPLGNFKRVAAIQQLYPGFNWASPFGVAMCYLLKQLDAAFILYATGRRSVTGEPISARLNDASVYAMIGRIIYEEETSCAGSGGQS